MKIDNVVALVTGANRGIGLAIARQLAELGDSVLLGSRDRDAGDAAAETLRQAGLDDFDDLVAVPLQRDGLVLGFLERRIGDADPGSDRLFDPNHVLVACAVYHRRTIYIYGGTARLFVETAVNARNDHAR